MRRLRLIGTSFFSFGLFFFGFPDLILIGQSSKQSRRQRVELERFSLFALSNKLQFQRLASGGWYLCLPFEDPHLHSQINLSLLKIFFFAYLECQIFVIVIATGCNGSNSTSCDILRAFHVTRKKLFFLYFLMSLFIFYYSILQSCRRIFLFFIFFFGIVNVVGVVDDVGIIGIAPRGKWVTKFRPTSPLEGRAPPYDGRDHACTPSDAALPQLDKIILRDASPELIRQHPRPHF